MLDHAFGRQWEPERADIPRNHASSNDSSAPAPCLDGTAQRLSARTLHDVMPWRRSGTRRMAEHPSARSSFFAGRSADGGRRRSEPRSSGKRSRSPPSPAPDHAPRVRELLPPAIRRMREALCSTVPSVTDGTVNEHRTPLASSNSRGVILLVARRNRATRSRQVYALWSVRSASPPSRRTPATSRLHPPSCDLLLLRRGAPPSPRPSVRSTRRSQPRSHVSRRRPRAPLSAFEPRFASQARPDRAAELPAEGAGLPSAAVSGQARMIRQLFLQPVADEPPDRKVHLRLAHQCRRSCTNPSMKARAQGYHGEAKPGTLAGSVPRGPCPRNKIQSYLTSAGDSTSNAASRRSMLIFGNQAVSSEPVMNGKSIWASVRCVPTSRIFPVRRRVNIHTPVIIESGVIQQPR